MKENVYVLEGLTCAHCAGKIEKRIEEMEGFKEVSLNFTTQTLSFMAEDTGYLERLQEEIDAIEDGVTVRLKVEDHLHHHMADALHDHPHDDGHHDHGEVALKPLLIRLGLGSLLFMTGLIGGFDGTLKLVIYLAAYVLIGGDVLLRAGKNILKGQVFDENFLMAIATVGAFGIGEYPEGVTVMLFYQIGELFQDMAVKRSRQSIESLMDIRPDVAWLVTGDDIKQVSAFGVPVGAIIRVKPGERIPLDGNVYKGESMLDTSALTGESVPRKVRVEDGVLSGSVNQTGLIDVVVTKTFGESTVSKILKLVEHATNKKAHTEKFITKFARYYTPIVVYLALALALLPPLILGQPFADWFHRALIFLVVSCPCALVISIPLGFFGGIGGASKHGVLIKGSNYLEALNRVDTVVFDKTGTLTKGVFNVKDVVLVHEGAYDLLGLAASIEQYSNHPIAKSILRSAQAKDLSLKPIDQVEEVAGHGLKGRVDGRILLVGNRKLMEAHDLKVPAEEEAATVIHVAYNQEYMGYITISDEIKPDTKEAIASLRSLGVKKLVMLTGDRTNVAQKVARDLGIDEFYSELLPHEKVEKLEEIMAHRDQSKFKTVFVGDGINDAPVLARADIGVAMGGVGSDAAIEAADVVLMTDEISKLADSLRVAKRTNQIVWQNIFFAMGVKILVLILGAGGLATMWEAVFADVGVALIAIFNAMRIIRRPIG